MRAARAGAPVVPAPIRLLAAVLVLLVAAAPLAAQDAVTSPTTVTGEVRDRESSAPVVGAAVLIPSLGISAFTDVRGAFRLVGVPLGAHEIRVVALGYTTLDRETAVAGGERLTFDLEPRPVALEELTVQGRNVERMMRWNRTAAMGNMRVIGREELLSQAAQNAEQVLAGRIQAFPCANLPIFQSWPYSECVAPRGTAVPVLVYVDEVPVGGLIDLRGYSAAELYAIEVHDRGTMVRVLTNRFVERLALGETRFWPQPVAVAAPGRDRVRGGGSWSSWAVPSPLDGPREVRMPPRH